MKVVWEKGSVVFLVMIFWGPGLFADDLTTADDLFKKRGDGFVIDVEGVPTFNSQIEGSTSLAATALKNGVGAFTHYNKVLIHKNSSEKQIAKALDGILRSAYFLGELVGDFMPSTRRDHVFDVCRKRSNSFVNRKNLATVAKSANLICTAYWFKILRKIKPLKALMNVRKLGSTFNKFIANDLSIRHKQLGIDLNYLGGGVERTVAAAFSSDDSARFNQGLRDREKAFILGITHVQDALARTSVESIHLNSDRAHTGLDYYGNHRVLAELYIELSKSGSRTSQAVIRATDKIAANAPVPTAIEKAKELLEITIEEIDERLEAEDVEDQIPHDLIVNAVLERRLLKKLLNAL